MLLYAEGLAPVDLLLLMAAQENVVPRVAELIRAGADLETKVCTLLWSWLLQSPTSSCKADASEAAVAFSLLPTYVLCPFSRPSMKEE